MKVLVLMSTYNGEKYLREQIDSILGQRGVEVSLLVRDDGSTDATLTILDEYKESGRLDYYCGNNLGPARSFMHLLQNAPASDFYAFSDQDDKWMDDKLFTAITSLEGHESEPALYFSQTQLIDAGLNNIPSVIIHPKLTFGESLIYKFIGGCTMVMNHRMREAVGNFLPEIMPMHDIWIYSIALGIGAFVHFDPTPHMFYRQHGNNTVGLGQGAAYEWKKRFKRFTAKNDERYLQARELSNGYHYKLTAPNAALLTLFLEGKTSVGKRLRMLTSSRLRCADRTTQLLFWINLLFNKY